MESGALVSSEKEGQQGASYTYWVRKITEDAAPLPVPRKLNPEDVPPCHSQSQSRSATLGSAWNRAGTWEEKSLNNWATPRIKELLISLGSIQFSFGRAEVEDVTKCVGDAFMVIVRNKKRVGYTYELSLKVKGEWIIQGEKKFVGGHIDVPEFSFGELDELQVEVRLSEARDILHQDKTQICNDLKLFLQPVREKLLQFEQELKIDR
uniref:Activator of Hsp90 ATPase AHSA1-like N-terminal domain-containing protein n=1 Tax=Glycine max TaxID=3847 RepID=C6SY60_SOYBN|nr:unknown [Glycine max]